MAITGGLEMIFKSKVLDFDLLEENRKTPRRGLGHCRDSKVITEMW
jgi:hypothetical protein